MEELEGFQDQSRSASVPVRIDYQSPRHEHFMRAQGEDWLFCFSPLKGQWNSGRMRKCANLNPYAVRNAFEAVKTPEEALRFLREAGRFWIFESVLWSQFKAWQTFFQWLRLDPDTAKQSPEGTRAWETAAGLCNSFFAQSDAEFTRARFSANAIEKYGAGEWKELKIKDRRILMCLRNYAFSPERPNEGNRVSIDWYDPGLAHPQEDWKSRRKRSSKKTAFEPYLKVEALYILEAVAATIYADQLDGSIRYGKCKHCGRLFKIESEHGQAFCPAPPHLESSPCKNAYLQFHRRKDERAAIGLAIEGLREGQSLAEIRKLAKDNGVRLTGASWEKAKTRFNNEAKVSSGNRREKQQ